MEPQTTSNADDWVLSPTIVDGSRRAEAAEPATAPKRSGKGKDAPIPKRLGRFEVLRRLGRGGMGVVLEAYDETLDRKVAVKQLHEHAGRSHRKRLVREAQALARLSHPNVVQVYDAGDHEGRLFIAMELVAGDTLWQWQKKPRSWSECVDVYMQAARGLAAAHAEGIIHRDFKPSNCIRGRNGAVKVLDFGLARGVDDLDDPELEGRVQTLDPGNSSGPTARLPSGQTRGDSEHGEGSAPVAAPMTTRSEHADEPAADAPDLGTPEPADPAQPLGYALDAPPIAATRSEPGSVRGRLAAVSPGSGASPSASGSSRKLSVRLTRTGALLGTPAYMAPEQALCQPSDARSDQFSFCVALYEAVYGTRPYGKQPALALLAEDEPPALRVPAPQKGLPAVPGWLHAVLARGLSMRKEDRYPSMQALLDAVSRGQRRRRTLGFAALGVLGLVGVAAVASSREAPCEGLRDEPMRGWTDTERAAVQATVASGDERGETVWNATARGLDDYAAAWTEAKVQACEATHVQHVASAELLDRRVECLDGRARRVQATTSLLAEADGLVAMRAAQLVRSLPPVQPCLDARRHSGAPPVPATLAPAAESIEDLLAQSWAFDAAGRAAQGLSAAEQAVTQARELGEPGQVLLARAQHNRGRVYRALGRFDEARDDLAAVVEFAERHDDEGESLAALDELVGVALDQADRSASAAWLSMAAGKLRRFGEDHPRHEARLRVLQGEVAVQARNYDEALPLLEAAVEALDPLGDDATIERARAWLSLGVVHSRLARDDDSHHAHAERAFDEALAIATDAGLLPLQAEIHHERGRYLDERGRSDAAEQALGRALELRVAFDGPHAPITIATRTLLARLAAQRGDLDAALSIGEDARKSLGPTVSPNRHAQVMTLLASFERGRGQWAQALDYYRQARDAWESSPSPDEVELAMLDASEADCLMMTDRLDAARERYERAIAVLDVRVPKTDSRRVFPLLGLAHLLFEQQQYEGAAAIYRRTWAIQREAADSPEMTAVVRWELGRAVLLSPALDDEQRTEAMAHVRAARQHFATIGDQGWVAEIDAFVDSLSPQPEEG